MSVAELEAQMLKMMSPPQPPAQARGWVEKARRREKEADEHQGVGGEHLGRRRLWRRAARAAGPQTDRIPQPSAQAENEETSRRRARRIATAPSDPTTDAIRRHAVENRRERRVRTRVERRSRSRSRSRSQARDSPHGSPLPSSHR